MPKKDNDEDPVCLALQDSPVVGTATCSTSYDTSQEDSGIQDGEKSRENTDEAFGTITLDVTGETESTDEGNETLAEASMPEGVELDTEGEEIVVEEKPTGPLSALDVVPSYDSDFKGVLTDVEYSMITGKKINDARPKQSCFNCLGNHTLNDCPKPPDYSTITANRKKLMGSRPSSVRYHEDCENKFGQFQPGKISENLRHALGLRPDQLPLYIYRMRVLGYPPGWMREAEVHQADVKMYDGVGRGVAHPDEEEGEAEPLTVKYKPEKLVSFPGFNDRMPRNTLDECHWFDCPPMQPCHQKSEFLHFMNQNKAGAYKKKKLKDSELRSKAPPATEEMDVDDSDKGRPEDIIFNPPLPQKAPSLPPLPQEPPPTSPPSSKRSKELEDGEISEDSQDSVGGLLIKKQKILQELEDKEMQQENKEKSSKKKGQPEESSSSREDQENSEDSQPSLTSNTDPAQLENSCSDDNPETKLSENPCSSDGTGDDDPKTKPSENSCSSDGASDDKPKTALSRNSRGGDGASDDKPKIKRHHRSHSKGFQLGTMIPATCTPYSCLPPPEKWTVDVSDHIVFDNLPDALGTWDKMKGIMGKVKTKMRVLHADEGD